jgi:hypothetical protein
MEPARDSVVDLGKARAFKDQATILLDLVLFPGVMTLWVFGLRTSKAPRSSGCAS